MYEDPTNALIYNEHEYNIPSTSRIHFHMREPNCDYKLTIEGAAPENLPGDSFNIEFYNSFNGGGFV